MSDEQKNGGYAFPSSGSVSHHAGNTTIIPSAPGMTLRDYFAGQAVATMLAASTLNPWLPELYAFRAYSMADAMLAERSKP